MVNNTLSLVHKFITLAVASVVDIHKLVVMVVLLVMVAVQVEQDIKVKTHKMLLQTVEAVAAVVLVV